MNISQSLVVALVSGVHIWQIIRDTYLWRLNVYFVRPKEGLDLYDARLL